MNHLAPVMSFDHLVEGALAILRSLRPFSRVPTHKLRSFIRNIELVALGVRTGYLFDGFSVPGLGSSSTRDALAEGLTALRKEFDDFNQVIIIHVPVTDDCFLVKASLFLRRSHSIFGSAGGISFPSEMDLIAFISLPIAGPPVLCSVPPTLKTRVRGIQVHLSEHQDHSYPLSIELAPLENESPTDFVPLAAFLLEYAVAYVPPASHTGSAAYLGGIAIDIFSCVISCDDAQTQQHILLQFSCPSDLAREIGDIASSVRRTFTTRLEQAGINCQLEVHMRTERLDRVAL